MSTEDQSTESDACSSGPHECADAEDIGNRTDLAVHEAFCWTCRKAADDRAEQIAQAIEADRLLSACHRARYASIARNLRVVPPTTDRA